MANKKRLIDANAFIKDWNELTKRMVRDADGKIPVDFGLVIRELSKTPTVDAVEVVRCKDCKCWDSETGFCDKHSRFYHGGLDWDMFNDDDFCSQGERRTDG